VSSSKFSWMSAYYFGILPIILYSSEFREIYIIIIIYCIIIFLYLLLFRTYNSSLFPKIVIVGNARLSTYYVYSKVRWLSFALPISRIIASTIPIAVVGTVTEESKDYFATLYWTLKKVTIISLPVLVTGPWNIVTIISLLVPGPRKK
jgi:hypothetical protein